MASGEEVVGVTCFLSPKSLSINSDIIIIAQLMNDDKYNQAISNMCVRVLAILMII